MYKNCVFIIESPNKIAKIKELTGSSFVFATGGHFVELVNIEVNKEFNPIFEIKKSTDKKKDKSTHINHMINQCKDKVVYIATDLDREGYGIGYKFYEKIKNLAKTIYRTEFHEITKSGVEKGLNNAVLFSQSNLNLYYSWLGRIVSDQFIGFTLTPYLRKNIKNFEVSAGRVQTPALSILVELDKKIQAFEQKNNDEKLSYSIEAIIDALGSQISIALVEENKMKVFETKELAQNFLNDLKNNLNPLAFLDAIEQKDKEKAPPKPFTTSNLLKDGVRILEMGVKQIQEHAQKLFEAGLITYIRTDSEALSKEYLQEHKAFFEGIYPSVYEYREYKAGKNTQTLNTNSPQVPFNPINNMTEIFRYLFLPSYLLNSILTDTSNIFNNFQALSNEGLRSIGLVSVNNYLNPSNITQINQSTTENFETLRPNGEHPSYSLVNFQATTNYGYLNSVKIALGHCNTGFSMTGFSNQGGSVFYNGSSGVEFAGINFFLADTNNETNSSFSAPASIYCSLAIRVG